MPTHQSDYARLSLLLVRLLAEMRERHGISQVELARRLEVDQPLVSKVERGVRRLDAVELMQWCRALGTPLSRFLGELEAREDAVGSRIQWPPSPA